MGQGKMGFWTHLLLKDKMVLRMKNFNILQIHGKSDLQGVVHKKKKHRRRDCLKRGAWIVYQFKGGRVGFSRKSGVVIMRGEIDMSMHIMLYFYVYFPKNLFLFFVNKNVFFSFSFLFCDEISNNRNTILTNQKQQQVIRNCLWNSMCDNFVINIR